MEHVTTKCISVYIQVGGDNPKVEGQEFFLASPGSGKRTLSQ